MPASLVPSALSGTRFRNWIRLLLLLGVWIAGTGTAQTASPVCIQGQADLRQYDFQHSGAIHLNGEWEFFWQELLPATATPDSIRYAQVPGMWLQQGLEGQGYASYRLRILLPHGLASIAIKMPELSTAYTLWVNGNILAQNGTVSTSADAGRAEYAPRLIHLHDPADTILLNLQVSNYHYYTGGIPQAIILGDYDSLISLGQSQTVYGAMLFGILAIIGLFHLAIYFFRPKGIYNLYYSLYCLISATNTLFVTERWLFVMGGPELWPLLYKIYIATIYLLLLVLIFFYSAFFHPVIPQWLKRSMATVFLLQAILVVVLPAPVNSWMEPIAGISLMVAGGIALFIFAKAIWKRMEGAILIACCNVAFLACFVLDGQLFANQISGIHLTHYMTVLYVVALSVILSRRIALAFNKVETLSVDLQAANDTLSSLNANLEAEVRERTRQVLQKEKMAVLGQLTANIAHEINTPMGAIKASIETLSIAYRKSLELFPGVWEELAEKERGVLLEMLSQVLSRRELLSSREERQKRQVIRQLMEAAGVPDAETLASRFAHAGLFDFDADRLALLSKPGIGATLAYLFENFEQISSIHNIQTALERVSKIMFAIKLYSRGGSSAVKTEISLEHDIQATVALYSSWFKKGIVLKTDFESMPPLLCFSDELLQVWTNLILNAVQAMGSSGTLEITARQVGEDAVITVADTGPGIPPEIIGKIFDPFFTTKVSGEGSGLGLDIVRTIVNRHEGTITVSSEPGRTVFTVKIPYTTP